MLPDTPRFWQNKGPLALMLWPLSQVYLLGHLIKTAFAGPAYKSKIPVLCVGGVVAGGSGKTPTVHALLKVMEERALYQRPVIVTRGYGGSLKGPTRVDPEIHTAADVGDEALLHTAKAPVIVSRKRDHGARLAEAMGADIILLDDGLQNSALHKNLSLLVIDATQGVGNGFLLPAGPLREQLPAALKKSAAVVETNGKSGHDYSIPVISSAIAVTSWHDKTLSYYAFAGLGRPEKFADTLDMHGFTVNGFQAFPDHHPYSSADMEKLIEAAGASRLITTEKDFVRVPSAYRGMIDVVSIELVFDKPDAVTSLLASGLSA